MRKIEFQMNAAILAGKDWKSANTAVVNADGISVVLLHGNKIAEVGDTFIRLFDGGWQTVTTKSRLNAILQVHGVDGEGIFQKKGEWFVRTVEGVTPENPKGFRNIKFWNSMRLG
jgi:hypothetical protein